MSHALKLGGGDGARVPRLSDLSCARMGGEWHRFAEGFQLIEARFIGARITLGL
jgi:hypothetical protein